MQFSNCQKFETWPDTERYHFSNFESLQVYRTWKLEVWRFPEVWKLGFFKVSTWTSLCVCACFMYMCVCMYTCIYICSSMYMNMSKYILYIYRCMCIWMYMYIYICIWRSLWFLLQWFLLHDSSSLISPPRFSSWFAKKLCLGFHVCVTYEVRLLPTCKYT